MNKYKTKIMPGERRLLKYMRRYQRVAKAASRPYKTPEERTTLISLAARTLYTASRIYHEVLQSPGVTPQYIDTYLSRYLKQPRKYSYYLQALSKYTRPSLLRRLALKLNTVDLEMLADEIQAPHRKPLQPTHELVSTAQQTLNEYAVASHQQAERLAKELILLAIDYIEPIARFEKLFRAIIPCAWCGTEAPLDSDGHTLRTTTINSVEVRLPCCPSCTFAYDEPNIYNIVLPILVYTVALENYLTKLMSAEQDEETRDA